MFRNRSLETFFNKLAAIKTIEISQTLKNRWKKADYAAKRYILDISCESVRSNSQIVEMCLRKPFEMTARDDLVPLNEAEETRTLNP